MYTGTLYGATLHANLKILHTWKITGKFVLMKNEKKKKQKKETKTGIAKSWKWIFLPGIFFPDICIGA